MLLVNMFGRDGSQLRIPQRCRRRLVATVTAIMCMLYVQLGHTSPLEQSLSHQTNIWLQNEPKSQATINHQLWQSFINTYLMPPRYGLARVNYAGVNSIDREKLRRYLAQMAAIHITRYNRKEQIAFWINVYNASVVQLILNHYPISNVLSIDPSPFVDNFGPWEATIIAVEGINLSLSDIRNHIIRRISSDGLPLFALCNGAIGAPNLGSQPYTGARLDGQLKAATKEYINTPRGAQVIDDKLYLSQFFQWYSGAFGGNEKAVIYFISQYASPTLSADIAQIHHITGYQYNWHLNKVLPDHRHTL